jgi:outer membrane protein assembly factor BamB
LFAVRPGGRGDITESHVTWKHTRGLPYVPSPLFYEGRVYVVKNGGMASCYEAKTGRVLYQEERLGAIGDYYASPVAADGKVYFASQPGVVTVIKAGDVFHVLAQNDLGEQIMATPAIVDGNAYFRTANYLSAFGETRKSGALNAR